MTDVGAKFRAMLDEAHADLTQGDAASGERRAKAVSAIVRAERDVAEFLTDLRAANQEHDEEASRAELLRRLNLYAEADRAGASLETLARIAETGSAS